MTRVGCLSLLLLATACGIDNGGELVVSRAPGGAGGAFGAVGSTSTLALVVRSHCIAYDFLLRCTNSTFDPIDTIRSARCSSDVCTVRSSNVETGTTEARVELQGNREGETTVEVELTRRSGRVESTRVPVSFLAATGLRAECTWRLRRDGRSFVGDRNAGLCPGRYALLSGAEVVWQAWPEHVDAMGRVQRLDAPIAVQPSGAALTGAFRTEENSGRGTLVSFTMQPGTGSVVLSGAGLRRTINVRGALPEEVQSLALRRWRYNAPAVQEFEDPLGPDTETEVLLTEGPPSRLRSSRIEANANLPAYDGQGEFQGLAVVGTLADGTKVLGGAGTLQSSFESEVTVSTNDFIIPDPWEALVWVNGSAEGRATITGTVGNARLEWPVEVVPTL